MEAFKHLEGTWEAILDSTKFIEKWEFRNNSLRGTGAEIKEGITLSNEKISISSFEGNIYYTAAAPGNMAPVIFKLMKKDGSTFVFSNPDHDFPKWIAYQFVTKDSTNVFLGGNGTSDGATETVKFHFKRVK